jgi:GAF domain-containing protein
MTYAGLAESLVLVARTISSKATLEETLGAIVDSARHSVPGFEHAGISTIDRRGRITTRAASDEIVQTLDDLQYELNEGPCVDAMRQDRIVVVPDIRHEQRWQRYVAAAARTTGLKSQLAVRLFLDDKGTIGGLNLYSTTQKEIAADAPNIAELFAAHAAIAFGHAFSVEGLNQALVSRQQIGQALGILMERHDIDPDQAFAYLARVSSHSNVKLRDVAQALIDEVVGRSTKPGQERGAI